MGHKHGTIIYFEGVKEGIRGSFPLLAKIEQRLGNLMFHIAKDSQRTWLGLPTIPFAASNGWLVFHILLTFYMLIHILPIERR